MLVADDSEEVRLGLRKILSTLTDIDVVGEAHDGVDAINKAKEYKPDVVLLDLAMPAMNGFVVSRIIKEELPSTRVVIVTQHDSLGFRREALAAGANTFIVKSDVVRDLLPELRSIQDELAE